MGPSVVGNGEVLSLITAKWRNLLNSQLLVYDGDRQVLANANTTKPLRRRNGLVVLALANKSAVPGSIPRLVVSFPALPQKPDFRRNTSQRFHD
jgi:hypothetical protein